MSIENSNEEETKLNGCYICIEEKKMCISPNQFKRNDCNHYACYDCWYNNKSERCLFCNLPLPKEFIKHVLNERLRYYIGGDDPNSVISLDLSNRNISNISFVYNLINLTELKLNKNQITDIEPLSNLINLTHLELNENRITDIEPLSNLINLTHLELKDNRILDFEPLDSLEFLETIS
jgi:Leucine-rich repeat (LRR) protein